METISLCDCEKNKPYFIKDVRDLSKGVSRRLSELGFYEGAKIKVLHFSALKKTLLIEIDGFVVSLRANIAHGIWVLEKK